MRLISEMRPGLPQQNAELRLAERRTSFVECTWTQAMISRAHVAQPASSPRACSDCETRGARTGLHRTGRAKGHTGLVSTIIARQEFVPYSSSTQVLYQQCGKRCCDAPCFQSHTPKHRYTWRMSRYCTCASAALRGTPPV